MRVALLMSDSVWQRALPHRIMSVPGVELVGIVLQDLTPSKSGINAKLRKPVVLVSKILQRLLYSQVPREIKQESLKRFGRDGQPLPWPEVELIQVKDINGVEAVDKIKALKPDVIAVSGTKLIKEPVFNINPPRGLLNLHTGISPYYKGGPNCTLWCLANQEPQYIGSTLHILDLGIDSGAILITEQTPVEAEDTAASLVCKAVSTGHDLYVKVLAAMAEGATLKPVPQSELGSGRTYLTREWNVIQLSKAVRYVKSGGLARWVAQGKPGLKDVRLVNVIENNKDA